MITVAFKGEIGEDTKRELSDKTQMEYNAFEREFNEQNGIVLFIASQHSQFVVDFLNIDKELEIRMRAATGWI